MHYPAAMAAYRQWITWQLVPAVPKPDKVPTDWRTGYACSAHDPEIWLSLAEATAHAQRMGPAFGVGFVFTEDDPFWFLDIDHALSPEGVWSPVAQQLVQAFDGAYVEVSSSGDGLHIVGSGPVPEHGCKNKAFGVELYTSDRFMAATFAHARGDAAWRNDERAAWLVQAYFARGAAGVEIDEITTAPVPEWRGPTDDDDLLRRAMQSTSGRAMFGHAASFADLWTRNVTVLSKAYPHPSQPYDESAADMALMVHLKFWTGANGSRMLQLMERSGLKREKWTTHRKYLRITCLEALRRPSQVCQDKPIEPPAVSGGVAEHREVTGTTFLSPAAQVEVFKGCVYVSDAHGVLVPGGDILDPARFKVRYGGYTFAMDMANERTVRNAFEAFTESQALRPPRADTTCFKPALAPGALVESGGRVAVNAWWPITVPRAAGSAGPFLKHLAKLLPNERDAQLLLCYLAACVQSKGIKFQWAPLLQGVEGNGKTFFSYCVMHAVGMRYSHIPRPDDISNKFNPWLRNKLVIAIEDVYVEHERTEIFERLKPMITGKYQAVEPKGVDQFLAEIVCNFIFNTNHKDGIRKTRNDRRIAPFFCAQQQHEDLIRDGMTREYFSSLYAWYEHGGEAVVNEMLSTMPIPDDMNPALGGVAPLTSSTSEAIGASMGSIEQHVCEAIAQGQIGFMDGWVSSNYLDKLLEDRGIGKRIPLNKRRALMQSLGYDWHPVLIDGRVPNSVMPDMGKPRLYVKHSHRALMLTTAADVARAYSAAQLGSVGALS